MTKTQDMSHTRRAKRYEAPRLTRYGSIRELTLTRNSGIGTTDDGSNCQGQCPGKRT